MQNKYIVILALLLATFTGYYFLSKQKNDVLIKEETVKINPVKKTINQTKTVKENTIIPKITEVKKADEKNVQKPVYDNDPIVDASLIISQNSMCINYLATTNGSNFMKQFQRQLNNKQTKYYQKFYRHCKELSQQHPELQLNNLSALKNQITTATASSLWGKIIKGETAAKSLNDFEINDLLKQNNLAILSQAPKELEHYYNKVIHWDIEDVLQNHQYDYVRQVQHYAHQLYLCNIGADCSPTSTTMAMLCYLTTQSCGLDYPNFISRVLTQGQQADIQLAMTYLQSKYQ